MAAEMFISILSLCFLALMLKMFFAPDDDPMGKISEVEAFVFILAMLTYFKGFDPFPPSLPGPFAALHLITIGALNGMAMIDFIFQTVFGVPISLDLLFGVLLPGFLTYGFTRSILKYTGVISQRTVTFIAYVVAFMTIYVSVNFGGEGNIIVTLMNWAMNLFENAGMNSIYAITATIFFYGLILSVLSVLVEVVAVSTSKAMSGVDKMAEEAD